MNKKGYEFREFVNACNQNQFIIGQGNPLSNILIIGCEPNDTDELKINNKTHTNECLNNINGKSFKDLWKFHKKRNEGWTWSKYQKIINVVYPDRKHINGIIDFEEMAFCTELNNVCARHSADADKSTISSKLDLFRTSNFIQSFPVVILACGRYINNYGEDRQIDDTFGVKYFQDGGSELKQNYWIHYSINPDSPKLVIHTRQLSGPIKNDLLFTIGKTIKEFLESTKLP